MSSTKVERLSFGAFEIDVVTGELRKDGVKVKLQDKPFAVLALLLERPGELVTREEFRERIWGPATYVDFDQGLNKAVTSIRSALGDSAEHPRFVETLPKRGYRFIAPLHSPERLKIGNQQVLRADVAENTDLDLLTQAEARGAAASPQSGLRPRTWYTRASLAGSILAAGFMLFFWARHNSEPKRELKLKQLTTNNGENFIRNSVVSPDGRYLLYGDQIGIHLRVIASGEIHTFQKPKALSDENPWYPTAWFPDQTHFIAVSETPTDQLAAPISWTVSVLGDGVNKLREGVIARSVSPDGSLVAFTSGGSGCDQEIGVMGAGGEEPTIVSRTDQARQLLSVEWSPDGRRLFDLMTKYEGSKSEDAKYRHVLESRSLRGGTPMPIVSYALGADSGFPDWSGGDSFWVLDGGVVIYNRSVSVESIAGNDDTNLWEIKINPETGKPQGEPRRLSNWSGNHLDHLSISRDGKTVVVQKSNWQLHTYIGELERPASARPLRRLTLEESDDVPYAWTPDSRAVLFHRTGRERIASISSRLNKKPQSRLIPVRV